MKVLFISGGDAKYGAPKSMMTLMVTLKKEFGVTPVLLTKKHNILNDYCDNNGIENYSCWYRDIMAGSPYSSKPVTLAKHLVKYICYLYGAWCKSDIEKLPLDFNTIDIIHTNINRIDIGAYIARKYNIKHIWHIREMGKEDYNVIFYKRNCIEYMNKNTDIFIAISDAVSRKWIEKGIDKQKIKTIYDGIEPEMIRKRVHRNDGILKIVITGHVQPNKGQLQIVKAIALLPDALKHKVKLDIIGEAYSDYKALIEKTIKEEKLSETVHLLGYKDNIYQCLADYDVGFTGSKAEGFGRCTVEYMMAGLLTIAADTGANTELIQNNETGILYQYGDINDLSQKIIWAIEHEKEREKIAREGCVEACCKYSQYTSAQNVYELYEECLK